MIKRVDKRVIQNFVVEKREIGKTDQEIYTELTKRYNDKKSIAIIITGTPTKSDKAKYKIYNYILIYTLAISVILRLLGFVSVALNEHNTYSLFLLILIPLIPFYFIREIYRYNAGIYPVCGLLYIATSINAITEPKSGIDAIINLVFVLIIGGLTFFLYKKLFPKYSPRKLKKNTSGDYILN
jgi:hypothetical protein